ncbi:MAG: hypothetical protein K6T78_02265 [Alicyclobacillus sp.]|nr:hypothetical protein [Alicyclobacillus sp.]
MNGVFWLLAVAVCAAVVDLRRLGQQQPVRGRIVYAVLFGIGFVALAMYTLKLGLPPIPLLRM